MARNQDLDPTQPSGSSSPRDGDNEIRAVKLAVRDSWLDQTSTDRAAVGRQTHALYGTNINATTAVITPAITLGGTAVTSTAAELNILDGVTASTSEINVLDGVTSSTSELNILDGVTATASELNTMDGVTATTAEINYLDNDNLTAADITKLAAIDASAAELNIMDGVTATTAEINTLDGINGSPVDTGSAQSITGTKTFGTVNATSAIVNGFTITSGGANLLDISVGGTTIMRISSAGALTVLNGITDNAGTAI